MECPVPIIFRPLKPPEPTRPGDKAPGETDPPLTLRDDPDNGTCPAMPGAAGPGNGAAHRRAALFHSSDRHVTAITGNRHHGRIHRHHHQHAGNRPRLARAERAGHPPMGVVARPVPPHPPRHPARRKRSPLAAGHPRFSFGPSGYAGLIIPASWNPSTPCRAHTVAPLMTEPILAGNASLDQTVQKKKSRTGIS